jgi:transcriptional regulator with XRE-family HTH domain
MAEIDAEAVLGEQVRAVRLRANRTQADVAREAGVSLSALRGLESGAGSSLGTLVAVTRALGRSDWLTQFAPAAPSVSPMALLRGEESSSARPRRRARRPRRTSVAAAR